MGKVLAQKKTCNTKNLVALPHPQGSENHAVRNLIHLRNGLRTEFCEKDKASFGKQHF